MAHRTVTDVVGTQWQVWETRPGPRSKVSPKLLGGWLTFESNAEPPEKRRLVPIAPGWDQLSDEALLALLTGTYLVQSARRTTAAALEESSAPLDRALSSG